MCEKFIEKFVIPDIGQAKNNGNINAYKFQVCE